MEIIKSEDQELKGWKNSKQSLRDLWGITKHTNICIMEVAKEVREKMAERNFGKIMTENFPTFLKDWCEHPKSSMNSR